MKIVSALCITALFAARASAANLIANPSFESALSPANWTTMSQAALASHPTLTVSAVRSTAQAFDLANAGRVTGRDHPADGFKQDILAAISGANGQRFLTRARIRCDAFAQARVMLRLGFSNNTSPAPMILAERVVHPGEENTWVLAEGSGPLVWTTPAGATLTSATLYFDVEQVFPNGVSAVTGNYPDYYVDKVEMDTDADGDRLWPGEEAALGTDPAKRDHDGDGMDDGWEKAHGTLATIADGMADADGDGDINYFEYLANTDPLDALSRPGEPTDALASVATRALLRRLAIGAALGRLVGQHAQDVPADYNNYVVALSTLLQSETGTAKWPAILSIAAEGFSPLQISASAPYARSYMDAGGICILHWTPWNPWVGGFSGNHTGRDIPALLTPGSASNMTFTGWMNAIADEVALFGADRPVIFRPFSEMNGGWNWYGRLSPVEFAALFQMVRNHFVNVRGLHNIIWTYEAHVTAHHANGISNHGCSMDYHWPGDALVDCVGFSCYHPNWTPGFDADAISRLHPKAFGITEGGPNSAEDDVPNGYNALYLDALATHFPRASFFAIWNSFPGNGGTTHNYLAISDNPGASALMTDPRAIARERLFYLPPTSLNVSATGAGSVSLAWSAAPAATGYVVESSANGVTGWAVAGTSATTSATITGLAQSVPRHFRVRATFPLGDSDATPNATATPLTAAQAWAVANLGSASAPLTTDLDADSLAEAVEYFLGTSPQSPGTAPKFGTVNVSGAEYLTITFTRSHTATDAMCIVQTSSDLATWNDGSTYAITGDTPITAHTTEVSRTTGAGFDTIIVRNNTPLGAGAQFLRLNVTVN